MEELKKIPEVFVRDALDNLKLGFAVSQDSRFIYANKAFCDLFGYTLAEIKAKSVEDVRLLIHPEDRERVMNYHDARTMGTPSLSNYSFRILRKNGEVRWLDGSVVMTELGGKPAFQMSVVDITPYKLAEEIHNTTCQRLRLAQELNNAGTWDWDIVRNSFFWSPEFIKVFGLAEDVVPGFEAWKGSLHPDDVEMASEKISKAIEGPTDLLNDYRIILPGGEVRWIRAMGKTLYDKGKPLRMIGLCIDITERINNDAALWKNAATLKLAAESTGIGTYEMDALSGKIIYSPEFLELLGLVPGSEVELDEHMVPKAVHPEDKEGFRLGLVNSAIPTGTGSFDMEYRVIRKNGDIKWLRVHGRTIFTGNSPDDKPLKAYGIIMDISDQVRIQEELRKQVDELTRFNDLIVGRELQMIELKKEINSMLTESGRSEKYTIVEQAL